MRTVLGGGALNVEQQERALDMLRSGMTQKAVAEQFGVTKNTIAGLWARQGEPEPMRDAKGTLFDRMDALHARLDAVLAKTVGVGRIAEPEREPRR